MQLLLTTSEEFGSHTGLGVIPGRVVRITPAPGFKVPHVGWAPIVPASEWRGSLLNATSPGTMTYFVHSFSAVPDAEEHRLADVTYGGFRICAAVRRGLVAGCQFHPEKSGPAGLAMLKSFLSL